ncbi:MULTISPECIES: peptide chain release factor N(5)-glutamine methyltransferase [Desulfobacula]|uniref:Release factor glutamine methyltransferase n=2 Tax=Desulfobacula TaxID=28222 RepID=K0NFA0_DESTT|nr:MULTISPECIES: peptide chain release factor N(5)-glutamine methyltransferase [Desulfobacula]CCK79796.1 HemK: protein methyltransferase [Desulfobacula toluolica Tol2]SDU22027.1 release factor glutamine methyltransferase [Desulfobacula phenolica]
MPDWTIIKILSWTESYFKEYSIDSPRLTAEILLSHCLGIKRLDLYLQHDRPLQKNELSIFKILIKRRIQNEPVAYITGKKGFFESDFEVEKGVLIPRPDTETIVEEALKILLSDPKNINPKTVLELGTGSGAIIVSLAKAAPGHSYFASDISDTALEIAKKNAEKIVKGKVRFLGSAWFSSLKKIPRFDLIVSNPPYIPSGDIQYLQPEIRKFEPLLALDGGSDGLDCFRSILYEAHHYLVPGGIVLFEMGFDQKNGIQGVFERYPQYGSIDFIRDLAGRDRVVLIKKTIDKNNNY